MLVTLNESKAQEAVLVAPSDSVDLAKVARGVYIGSSGDLRVTLEKGTTVTFTALSGGIIHPIAAKRIHATGTTATNILAVN